MTDVLRERLRKIEALLAGAGTSGERDAAAAAAERIRARLAHAAESGRTDEMRFSIPDPWSRRLFVALCRRHGLNPYRYRRMQRQTVVLRVPKGFVDEILWPEFTELSAALTAHLAEITERLIRAEVHGDTSEPEEVEEPKRIGR